MKESYSDAKRRIKQGSQRDEKTKCWRWMGAVNNRYGSIGFQGKNFGAHVLSWILWNEKPIPEGLIVLHTCKQNPLCVNPNHLKVGTIKDNSDDSVRDGTNYFYNQSLKKKN